MEQARYWMWTKQNHSLNSHLQASNKPSYDDSWEEQAFAEDAAGPLGGCIWPPRSYSCSFCRRDFRSAQALGGHMNVHRRDRARLKQSPTPHNEVSQNDRQNPHNQLPNTLASFGFRHPSQLYTSVCTPNLNSDPGVIPSPSSSSRVSTTPAQENCPEKAFFPLSSSSVIEEDHKWSSGSCPPSMDSRLNIAEDRCHHFSDPTNIEAEKKSRILESGRRAEVDCVKTDLSVSLNLVVRRTRPTISDGEEEAVGCKRRRTESGKLKSPFPLSLKSNSVDRLHVQSGVFEISGCSREEVDLELRLGDPPKVT